MSTRLRCLSVAKSASGKLQGEQYACPIVLLHIALFGGGSFLLVSGGLPSFRRNPGDFRT
jgi:hypothetical protein